MCIVNKYNSETATTQTVIKKIRENIYAPLENDNVVANLALIHSNSKLRLNELVENIGKPLATFERFDRFESENGTVLVVSGLSSPNGKLDKIKQLIDGK